MNVQGMYKLLKFSLSNGGLKKIQCLIWGDELINQYQSELTTNEVSNSIFFSLVILNF